MDFSDNSPVVNPMILAILVLLLTVGAKMGSASPAGFSRSVSTPAQTK